MRMLKSIALAFAMLTTACLSTDEEPDDSQAEIPPVSDDAEIQTEYCADIVVVTPNVTVPCFLPNGSTGTQKATRTCVTDRGIVWSPTVPPTHTCQTNGTSCTYVATTQCK